jgi:hypothetical protein
MDKPGRVAATARVSESQLFLDVPAAMTRAAYPWEEGRTNHENIGV